MVRVHVDQKADANRQGTANIDKTLNKDRVLYHMTMYCESNCQK